jgi:uncharacterized protein YrrD
MFITASKIFNLPIASLESKSKIGVVSYLLFSPHDLNLLALEVKTGNFLFSKKLYLSAHDILEIDSNGIVVKSDDTLVDASQIVRIKDVIKQKSPIIGQRAITKSKQRIGKIDDLLIDTLTGGIDKFYISNIFEEKIIPASKIYKITPKAVIFCDDILDQTIECEPEGAVA